MLISARRGISYPVGTRGDQPDIPLHFANLINALDLDTPFYAGLASALPTPASRVQGSWYYATDSQALYYNNGTAWVILAPLASPVFTGTPTAPTPALTDVSTKIATTQFVRNIVPAGVIWAFGGSTAPSGFYICDGSAKSRTTDSLLFGAIGTAYGVGDGSTTFNIPNLQGRVPVGKDSGTFVTLGATGGEQTHVLSTPEMPAHTHSGNTGTESASHSHVINIVGNSLAGNVESATGSYEVARGATDSVPIVTAWASSFHGHGASAGTEDTNHTHAFTTGSTGGGTAHNNLQPYQVVNWIIKN